MRDDHHCHAFLGKFDHDIEHLVDHLRIECRGWLIEQHRNRLHRQRARDGNPLLLATGKLRGVFVLVFNEANAIKQFEALLTCGGFAPTEHLGLRHHQILCHAHVREKFEILKYHADARA